MIKSDVDIHELLVNDDLIIERDGDLHVGPGSIDLHLQDGIKRPLYQKRPVNVRDKGSYPRFLDQDGMVIPANGFALATTEERIELPVNLSAFIWGRSSVGRLGLFVHNAGFTDPGYCGELTLELVNAAPYPIELEKGMRVCQITLHEYDNPPSESYGVGGKYQGQKGATESKLYEDYE